jgi:purine nucleosidase
MPRLIVDTDGASDDAAALLMAAASPDLAAVTVTGGVVPVEQAVHNVLVILAVAGRDDVPVHRGAARSLIGRPFEAAEEVHGPGGLGGHRFDAPAGRQVASPTAPDVLRDALSQGDATIVTLGPLTDLAMALSGLVGPCGPGVRVVAMAGSQDAVGNVTPVAEYNVYCDPEAAAHVLGAGLDTTLVGWDVSRRDAVIGDAERARLKGLGTPAADFLVRVNQALDRFCRDEQGLAGYDLPDAAAMAVALDPAVVTWSERLPVDVETAGRLTRGMTVVDHRGSGSANATVVWSIDHGRFVDDLVRALGG